MAVSGQTQPTRASLKDLLGASPDPPIPDALAATAQWGSHVPKAAVSNYKKIDLYTKAPVTRRVPLLSRAYQSGFYHVAPVWWTPQYNRRRWPQCREYVEPMHERQRATS